MKTALKITIALTTAGLVVGAVIRADREYKTVKVFGQSKRRTFIDMKDFLNQHNVKYIAHHFEEDGLTLIYEGFADK